MPRPSNHTRLATSEFRLYLFGLLVCLGAPLGATAAEHHASPALVLPQRKTLTLTDLAQTLTQITGTTCLCDRRVTRLRIILTRRRYDSVEQLSQTLTRLAGLEIRSVGGILFIAPTRLTAAESRALADEWMKSALEAVGWDAARFRRFLPHSDKGSPRVALYAHVSPRELPRELLQWLVNHVDRRRLDSADAVEFRPAVQLRMNPGDRFAPGGFATARDRKTGVVRQIPVHRSLALNLTLW